MATATAVLYDSMAAHGPSSPAFIKPEPDEFYGSHKFNKDDSQFHQQNGAHYGPWQPHNVNPMDINVSGNHAMSQYTPATQSMPNNFVSNNSMLSDDDLIGSLDVNNGQQSSMQNGQQQNQYPMVNGFSGGFSRSMHHSNNQAHQLSGFSSTPDGAPIQSPFQHGFDFGQWQANPQQSQRMSHQMSRSISGHGIQEHNHHGPMTPMTPPNNGMPIGHHVHNGSMGQQGHQRNTSGQWDNSLGSGYSQPFDSPLASPAAPVHAQISEVLKTGTSAPSPAVGRTNGKPTTTAEMKKAKRRASHNEVERRRRNHINDRIMELADLVPKHRLEDEAVRRSVASNSTAMPLGLSGSGISPPGGSGLAGSHGRRAGSVGQGPLADDKDKGPAKGEVLDGAVSWTRDLLWMMNGLLAREQEMRKTIAALNGTQPRQWTDDEVRMLSEAKAAIHNNIGTIQSYTRRHGSDLYVPGHTNHAGEPVAVPVQPSLSPPSVFDIDGPPSGNSNAASQYFNYGGGFKEEDELPDLEMN